MADRILIVKLSSMGDVLHTLPAAQAVRAAYPRAHLAWAVEKAHADLLQDQGFLDEVIVWERGTWRGFRSFLARLRRTPWDLALDFQGLARSALITRLSGARRRVGFGPGREMSHLAYHRCVAPPPLDTHAVERSMALAAAVGGKLGGVPLARPYLRGEPAQSDTAACSRFPLAIRPADQQAVQSWLDAQGHAPQRRLVVVCPHARREANCWPEKHFVTLVRRLIAGGDAQVVLSAGPAARPLCDAIAAAVDGQIGRADGQFSLKQSAELYSRAATVVTADTGTMHLAAAVNAPIVALLGPTNPVRTGPYTTNATLLNRQLACSPCYKKTCPLGHKPAACMDQISPESVYAAVRASWTEADGSAWRRSA